jgi:hypothetical protein
MTWQNVALFCLVVVLPIVLISLVNRRANRITDEYSRRWRLALKEYQAEGHRLMDTTNDREEFIIRLDQVQNSIMKPYLDINLNKQLIMFWRPIESFYQFENEQPPMDPIGESNAHQV